MFWSRRNGWVIVRMARALEFMPKNDHTRQKYAHPGPPKATSSCVYGAQAVLLAGPPVGWSR